MLPHSSTSHLEGSDCIGPRPRIETNLRKSLESPIGCNELPFLSVLVRRPYEREKMIKSKKVLLVATAGVVALGYAAVSTNAFADSSVTPVPTISIASTTAAAVTPPAVPAIPADASATTSSNASASTGIHAPSGLANSSLSTMPAGNDDDGDDQSAGLSAGVSLSGDDSADDNGDDSVSVGASLSLSGSAMSNSPQSNNGGNSQQGDGQDDSGSDD